MRMRSVGVVFGAIAISLATLSAVSTPSLSSRARAALDHSTTHYTQWLGPPPADAADAHNDHPWLSAPLSMDVESAVAYRTALRWWKWPAGDASAAQFFQGLSWYLQGRTIERQFDLAHGRPGHSVVGARFFGGHVPWTFPFLPVDRFAADDAL
ncbi:MAG: hypothetical protein ACKOEC_05860, partial [Acidimicrobiia bacterium]